MDSYRIGPIRPPSEANSLLLQITNGCTWNKCKFCKLYRHTKFKAYSADSIKADIDSIARIAERVSRFRIGDNWDLGGLNGELRTIYEPEARESFYNVANWMVSGGQHVFLQDGNSTVLSGGRLTDVLTYLKESLPGVTRITSYGRAENLSKVSAEEFMALKAAGLDRIHSGFETGSDAVLQRINKGVTQEQEIKAGKAIKAGGIELSIYFMPGVGGKDLSVSNAEETAYVINEVDPDFVRIRTAAIKPGTELYEDWQNRIFSLCSDDDKVMEIRRVIELADRINVTSDHMINLLQDVEGEDKAKNLALIDKYLDMPKEKRRVFQLLRRSFRVYDLEDFKDIDIESLLASDPSILTYSDEAWDIKMNEFICRYV